jgi:maltooligosyltrehalose trehalohydrolase
VEIISPAKRTSPLKKNREGYWHVTLDNIVPGARYLYQLEGARNLPDPASFLQGEGVHGPSVIVDHAGFQWDDQLWQGMDLEDMIIYELHAGTFTPEGTFEAIIQRLPDLRDLGITALELMPVAQFPGERNWGYDGVYPFAVQNSYGGPEGLKKLVNACHQQGIAVVLDVVYNHLGPEGNYLAEYGPYFTEKYRTPWGRAINFDSAYSDGVRNYFVANALFWFRHYHIDALRLDAIHGIFDMSARHILEELAENTGQLSAELGRKFYLIAESDLNSPRIIKPRSEGGCGIDAQWCDDFHHALHTLLTGDQEGYYIDFGSIKKMQKAFQESYVYSGEYSAYRKRFHGAPVRELPARQFIVFSQNHDHIGNRMLGERLSGLISFEGLKLAAGTVFTSTFVPLLFMGEEYGEDVPFLYFIDHSDPGLIQAVRDGRKKEFQSFKWHREPPDPQSMETFLACRLAWEKRSHGKHNILLNFYKQLIHLKKTLPALRCADRTIQRSTADEEHKLITFERCTGGSWIFIIMNFNRNPAQTCIDVPEGTWNKLLDSADTTWMGPGALLPDILQREETCSIPPLSIALYERK